MYLARMSLRVQCCDSATEVRPTLKSLIAYAVFFGKCTYDVITVDHRHSKQDGFGDQAICLGPGLVRSKRGAKRPLQIGSPASSLAVSRSVSVQ